jgi:hypothetical protein
MPIYHNSTTPVAESRKKLIKWQYDGTPNLSGEFDLDVKVNTSSATGSVSVDAIETTERATAGASDITRTLPAASGLSGYIVTVKKVDSGAGAVIVQGNGSPAEAIDGATTWTLSNQYQYVRLQCNGTGWDVIGNN